MMTSKFAYPYAMPDLPKHNCYVQTFYANTADIPQEWWDTRVHFRAGWYRYTKETPYTSNLKPHDLPWFGGVDLFYRQIELRG